MLEISNGRKVAVLDGENAVVKIENMMRIVFFSIDYARREAVAVFKKGYLAENNSFYSQDMNVYVVEFRDLPEREEPYYDEETQTLKRRTLPPLPLFTLLITSTEQEKDRQIGDISIINIETLIIEHNLLPEVPITGIYRAGEK